MLNLRRASWRIEAGVYGKDDSQQNQAAAEQNPRATELFHSPVIHARRAVIVKGHRIKFPTQLAEAQIMDSRLSESRSDRMARSFRINLSQSRSRTAAYNSMRCLLRCAIAKLNPHSHFGINNAQTLSCANVARFRATPSTLKEPTTLLSAKVGQCLVSTAGSSHFSDSGIWRYSGFPLFDTRRGCGGWVFFGHASRI